MSKAGLVVGRFQPIHKGHIYIVEEALKQADQVLILVGSSQEAGTDKNPFSYELRRELIEVCFPKEVSEERLIIKPLPDAGLGNVAAWGDYVINKAQEYMGRMPELFVSGVENRRVSWFDNYDIKQLVVDKVLGLNATDLRVALLTGDYAKFKESVPEAIYPYFESLSEIMVRAHKNKESDSI